MNHSLVSVLFFIATLVVALPSQALGDYAASNVSSENATASSVSIGFPYALGMMRSEGMERTRGTGNFVGWNVLYNMPLSHGVYLSLGPEALFSLSESFFFSPKDEDEESEEKKSFEVRLKEDWKVVGGPYSLSMKAALSADLLEKLKGGVAVSYGLARGIVSNDLESFFLYWHSRNRKMDEDFGGTSFRSELYLDISLSDAVHLLSGVGFEHNSYKFDKKWIEKYDLDVEETLTTKTVYIFTGFHLHVWDVDW